MDSRPTTPISAPEDALSAGEKPLSPARAPLKLAAVISSVAIPRWIATCLQEIDRSPQVELEVVCVLPSTASSSSGGESPRVTLPLQIYRKLDRVLFPAPGVSFDQPAELQPHVDGAAVLECTSLSQLEQKLAELDLDVVLQLGPGATHKQLGRCAKQGLWALSHGCDAKCSDQLDGFWEVINNEPVTISRLYAYSDDGSPQLLAESNTHTRAYSAHRNQNALRWKGIDLVLHQLAAVFHDTTSMSAACESRTEPHSENHSPAPLSSAESSNSLGNIRRLAWDIARRTCTSLTTVEWWSVAVNVAPGQNPLEPRMTDFQEIKSPAGTFWADPFILQREDKNYLFVEEFVYRSSKGHLAFVELDSAGNYLRHGPIIEKESHLSYPFVFEWEGETYLVPENSASGEVTLYQCTEFPDKWVKKSTLLSGVSSVDPTLFHHEGRWWLFISEGRVTFDELCIYHADSLAGPWIPHKRNPVKADVRSSRPAGKIFQHEGQLYRPAQDCTREYGYAIVINRILELSPDSYREEEVSRILPDWRPDLHGTHMFNHAGNVTVIDQKFRRLRFRV